MRKLGINISVAVNSLWFKYIFMCPHSSLILSSRSFTTCSQSLSTMVAPIFTTSRYPTYAPFYPLASIPTFIPPPACLVDILWDLLVFDHSSYLDIGTYQLYAWCYILNHLRLFLSVPWEIASKSRHFLSSSTLAYVIDD
jgi:hypothetical protein